MTGTPRVEVSNVARALAAAVGSVVLAWSARAALNPLLENQVPFLFFLPAIVGVAWFFGRGAGLIVTVLSGAAGAGFMGPLWDHGGLVARRAFATVFFVLVGFAMTFAVSAMRRARDEARELGAEVRRLAALVASSEDAIIVKDLEGRILEWNGAAERLFGYPRDEAVGRSIEILMPPDRADDWRKILGRLAHGERVEHFETRRRARDGRILDVSLTVSPVRDPHGRIVGAAKIVRDVTADREAMRERERTRDLFLGMLSHDLRTPLNAIAISAETLRRRVAESDRAVVARISNGVERMSRMIGQLLDVTRSRLGGGIPIRLEAADLASVCRATADEFEAVHPGRIHVLLEGELLGRWDADRLHEVVSNLLSNALLYGATDHPVTLSARGDGPSSVVVDVMNRGPEVPASLLPLLFDPFRRGPGEERRSGEGLGLGLYIAREIVRAHHGEITVRSSAAEGTTFTVTLPRSADAPDAAGPA